MKIKQRRIRITNNNNDCNRVAGDNEEGSKGARMHQADWQYQCAHRPIEALSHCPPSLSHCPANPSGNPGRGCYRRYHTATIRPSPPSDDPPIHRPVGLPAHHIGYWKCSAWGGSSHPTQMLRNLLAFFLIFWKYPRISLSLEYPGTNSFPRHDITWLCYQNITPYIWSRPPHKIIRPMVSILGHAHVGGTWIRVWDQSESRRVLVLVLVELPNCSSWVTWVAPQTGPWQGPIMASAGYRACTAFLRSPIQTGAGNVLLPPSQYPMKPKKSERRKHRWITNAYSW